MGSILDDIEITLDNGTSMGIVEKIFIKTLNNAINRVINTHGKSYLQIDTFAITRLNKALTYEVDALMQMTIKDLYEYFYLNEDEIRHLCKSDYVCDLQNNSYNFYSADLDENDNRYEIEARYEVNIDNALYLLNGGDIFIKWQGNFETLSNIKPIFSKSIRNYIEKAHVGFSHRFYDELKEYCYKNFKTALNSYE